jgi:hypothetical protein
MGGGWRSRSMSPSSSDRPVGGEMSWWRSSCARSPLSNGSMCSDDLPIGWPVRRLAQEGALDDRSPLEFEVDYGHSSQPDLA